MDSSSLEDLIRTVDDHAFHKETSVAFSDWQASLVMNSASRDAAMSAQQLEERRPGSRSGPNVRKTPIPEPHAGSAKFYVPPAPRHIFENAPEPVAITAGGKLGESEWENEIARSVLALYRCVCPLFCLFLYRLETVYCIKLRSKYAFHISGDGM